MSLLLVALVVQSAEPAGHFPPALSTAPPAAVDHVAIVHISRDHGQPDEDQRVMRSGSWIRTEAAGSVGQVQTTVTHSDLSSGNSITWSRDANGGYRALTINRHSTADTYDLRYRTRTGQRDRALGEACEVWRTRNVDPAHSYYDHLTCETSDGIELWSRNVLSNGTELSGSTRTVELQRRPVARQEVLPPRDVLRWSYWRGERREAGPQTGTDRQPQHYEVRMEPVGGRGHPWLVNRRRGDWRYRESIDANGQLYVEVDNGLVQIYYRAEAEGRPVSLMVSRAQPGQVGLNDLSAFAPTQPRRSERILGEECFWSGPSGAQGIDFTSGGLHACITSDALALRTIEGDRAIASYVATGIDRGRQPASALMPPAAAFDWRNWGVEFDR